MDKKLFINAVNNCDNIKKDDIVNLASECGLEISPRTAKLKIIDAIAEDHFEKLFEYFNEFITIPYWEIADFYGVSSNKILSLKEIGFIKEEPIKKEFYSRRDKRYYDADTFPISVLSYNKDELIKAYESAFGGATYKFRIETKTKEEVTDLISILGDIVKINDTPVSYSHRNNDGFYTYFDVKTLNSSEYEANKLLLEIKKLKEEKEEINKIREKLLDEFRKYLGDDLNRLNIEDKLNELIEKGELIKGLKGIE